MDKLERPLRIPPQFVDYANKHSLFALQKDLLKRLIISKPPDPLAYLINILKHHSVNKPSIFIIGPPCVGKFTLGKYLSGKLNCVHIPERELNGAAVDNIVQENLEAPMIYGHYLSKRLTDEDCEERGYVLSGFPQTVEQAKVLQMLGIFPEKIVFLDAKDCILEARASGKVIDSVTRDPYHELFNPPSDPKVQARLVKSDEHDFQERIKAFRRNFITLKQMYEDLLLIIKSDEIPLSDIYRLALCRCSIPPRNPAMWTPRVLLLGFAGAGRKSSARKLAERYKLVPVHCGTLIRREVIRDTKLGRAMKIYVDTHSEVPSEMVIELLKTRLTELDCALHGWVLLGYPRTREQARALDKAQLAPNRVMFLNLGHAEAAARINLRRFDRVTGDRVDVCAVPPPAATQSNTCGATRRPTTASRLGRPPGLSECEVSLKLTTFAARRAELLKYYGDRALNVNADAGDEEKLFQQIESFLINELPRSTSCLV